MGSFRVQIASTYRLQLSKQFTFDDAAACAGYLASLGVTRVYCSPILQATHGSSHGYDVVDPTRVNDDLGGEVAFRRLITALNEHGLQLVVDIVPIARRVVEVGHQLPERPLIMVHDYQLYLVPKMVRRELPGAIITHFVHIPWPTPQYWKVLPRHMRDAILEGLLGCDIVGFQSSLDVRNFLMTCDENAGLAVDDKERAVLIDGRVVYARHYPISIEVAATTRLAFSHSVLVEERKLREWRPEHLIVRIDRTDPSKNIVRGFLAYEKLLDHHPELKGHVQFWAFLQPSRQDVAVYRDYLRLIRSTAHRINRRYGGGGWSPIRLDFGESVRKAMAALRNFDVLLVNPVYDGLNLVSKEGALVNRNNGVIVLSENAGAYEELHPHVLSVNPFDIEATADAIYRGLVMGAEEKRRRNEGARDVVRTNDISRWISRQVQDIRDLVGTPGMRARMSS